MKPTLDPNKLTPEQRDKLESYQQAQDQLQLLEDIAKMVEKLISDLADQTTGSSLDGMGALMMDMRDSLNAIKNKEDAETPDYAKPVVQAVSQLEKSLTAAIKAIDVKPSVAAPNVNIPEVDLRGVEKAIKEIPKAFADAIKLIPEVEIPETDNSELLRVWGGISEQLVSIENATRLKPIPGSMKISNLAEITTALKPVTYATKLDDYTTTSVTYVGKAPVGTQSSNKAWQIMKMDETTGLVITWAGSAGFTQVWDNRSSLSYA